MRAEYIVDAAYLYLPISAGKPEHVLEIFSETAEGDTRKIYEFKVPLDENAQDEYPVDYMAQLPVSAYLGKKIVMKGSFTDAFFSAVRFGEWQPVSITWRQPAAHASAAGGWSNDPNGMFFDGHLYHLYFQYNPVNVIWRNMSWGHVVSSDLVHWQQKPAVMFPDETGTMFSGCAVRNTRGCMGLPEDAVIYFYTAAGDSDSWSSGRGFMQMTAVSTDGGQTLVKTKKVCIPMLAKENRDPKVFYHSPSEAYVMVLFLDDHDYAIFRSQDLENWEETQRLTLPDTWECPDLFCLYNEADEPCWFFWTADGYYWPGEFDGYHFEIRGARGDAYTNPLPYAAQTFDSLKGRTVTIPWLRLTNDGRPFTGAYGFPCELGWTRHEGAVVMTLRPARELFDHLSLIKDSKRFGRSKEHIDFREQEKALYVEFCAGKNDNRVLAFNVNGGRVSYDPATGILNVEGKKRKISPGFSKIAMMADDRILEIWLDDGKAYGAYEMTMPYVSFEAEGSDFDSYRIYEVR